MINKTHTTLRIHTDLYSEIKGFAEQSDLSISKVAETLIREGLSVIHQASDDVVGTLQAADTETETDHDGDSDEVGGGGGWLIAGLAALVALSIIKKPVK